MKVKLDVMLKKRPALPQQQQQQVCSTVILGPLKSAEPISRVDSEFVRLLVDNCLSLFKSE